MSLCRRVLQLGGLSFYVAQWSRGYPVIVIKYFLYQDGTHVWKKKI